MHNIEAINKRIKCLLLVKQSMTQDLLSDDCDDNEIFEKLKQITEELVRLSNMKNEESMNKFIFYTNEEIRQFLINEQEILLQYQEEANILEKEIAAIPNQVEELYQKLNKLIREHRNEKNKARASEIEIEQAEKTLYQRLTPAF